MPIIPNINNQSIALLSDIEQWKEDIANAINSRGGTTSADDSFQQLATEIQAIPSSGILSSGVGLENEFYFLQYFENNINTSIKSINSTLLTGIERGFAFYHNVSLQSVELPNLATISGTSTFSICSSLQSVELPNLATISGISTFSNCSSLQSVELPNLATISGTYTFSNCYSLQSVELPNLATISGNYTFLNCSSLQSVEFGRLILITESFTDTKKNLRNITIGAGTDVNLPFKNWTATNVIAKGQSGIEELNSNLYNNLLTKLYDHSGDGETRTLRIGWLDYVSKENIAYATAKGWTLTT